MSGIHHARGTSAGRQAEEARQNTPHARHASHGRGQFNGYTFRLGRAPMQNTGWRPQPLRPRPAAQRPAQADSEELNVDTDLMQGLDESERNDGERPRSATLEDAGRKGAGQRDEQAPAPLQARLKVRLPPAKTPAPPLPARLRQAGWPGADLLWSQAPQRPSDQQLVQALVAGLLAAARPAAARPAAAGSGTVLRLALTTAFLRSGAGTQDLSTLAKVKALAMAARAAQPRRSADAPLTEEESSANVLAILQLLMMSRPLTKTQRRQAIDRQDLLSRSSCLQGAGQ